MVAPLIPLSHKKLNSMQFSSQIKETISQSQVEAIRLGNNFIGIEHLLLGLLRENGDASGLFKKLNIDLVKVREEAEHLVQGKKMRRGITPIGPQSLPLSDQAEKVILDTVREAKARKSSLVEAKDLVLSIVKNDEALGSLGPARQSIDS